MTKDQERQQLPLGTVVNVNGYNTELMIISQFPIVSVNGKEGYFDFGGTPLPSGMTGSRQYFFNKEDILEVNYLGYVNIDFQQLLNQYDEMVSKTPYKKLNLKELLESQEKMNDES